MPTMEKKVLIDFIQASIPNFKVSAENLGIIAANFDEIEFAKNDFLLKA